MASIPDAEEIRAIVRAEIRAALAEAAPSPDVLTTAQAARIAGVDPETIREWHRAGRLRASRSGRTLRIGRTDLEDARRGDSPDPREAAAQALRLLRHG